MKWNRPLPEQLRIARQLIIASLLVIPIAVVTGSLVALFLWLLDFATTTRWAHPWLLFLLPAAGMLIVFLYRSYGGASGAGNNLIMDEIHRPGGGIPKRMAPLVLLATVLTHLFGGSAGREGTAVQIGGTLSAFGAGLYRVKRRQRRMLLLSGMAAGFGAVFGTPVTGALFALEVQALGKIRFEALVPCLFASIIADATCVAWGIHHTHYAILFIRDAWQGLSSFAPDLLLLLKVVLAGAAFGLVSFLFSELSHRIKEGARAYIKYPLLMPVAGGLLVIGISCALGTFDYLGLGVTNPAGGVSIVSAFQPGGAGRASWWWKLLLTAITLGTGFKGGEVTPLFFIGATLGNFLASFSGAPVDLFAGLGFIAVFAGAANTPLACTMMGIELFGAGNVVYYAVACFTAYYFSGHSGIYGSQRIGLSKFSRSPFPDQTLSEFRQQRRDNYGKQMERRTERPEPDGPAT